MPIQELFNIEKTLASWSSSWDLSNGGMMIKTHDTQANYAGLIRICALVVVLHVSVLGCTPVEEDLDSCDHESVVLSLSIDGRWQPSPEATFGGQNAQVVVTNAGPWNGESSCSGTFTQGAQQLSSWLQMHWPQITHIGGYSCRPINGRPDITSIHAVGRALDVFIPLHNGNADNDLGDPIANYLMEHAQEIGIQRVIWDRTSFTSGNDPREYTGAHPHHDHLHVELSVDASNLDSVFFRDGMPGPTFEPCAPPLLPQPEIIDSLSDCLSLFGPSRFWRTVDSEGYGGSLFWTNAYVGDEVSNLARWAFRVQEEGEYTIETHSVAAYSVYPLVRYELAHEGENTPFNVSIGGRDGWVEVTTRFLRADTQYFLNVMDNYETAGDDQHIIVDALRITPTIQPSVDASVQPEPTRPDQGLETDAELLTEEIDAAPQNVERDQAVEPQFFDATRVSGDVSLNGPIDAPEQLKAETGCTHARRSNHQYLVFLGIMLVAGRRRRQSD